MKYKPELTISKEKLCIRGGLGPLQYAENNLELEILPMTVFIGPQGTGKSLISQLLYFFRDAEYLLDEYSEYSDQIMPGQVIRSVIEGIRGGPHGSLIPFLTSDVHLSYETEYNEETIWPKLEREISITRNEGEIQPLNAFDREVRNWFQLWLSDPMSAGKVCQKSVFVPAERTFYSRFINSDPKMFVRKGLPLTTHEFGRSLMEADDKNQRWRQHHSFRPDEADDIDRLVSDALGGKVVSDRNGSLLIRKLQWLPRGADEPIKIETASSGQMSAWPLIVLAQAMFTDRQLPLFLHIEEPEAHLHPAAQVAIVKLLTYLVNHGIRVVITTHSLTVLYALNNLTLAYRQLEDKEAERVPEPSVRLAPDKLAAYLFADGKVENIVNESGQIDEGLLGRVLGDLQVEFNRLMAYKILWE